MRRLIIPILIIFLSPVSVYQAEAIRTCTRVIDGDTIVLDGGERVRLIGVDTPETVHPTKPVQKFGVEASDFTKWLVEGKRVTLEYDQDRKDKYGRTLAYVYLENGTMVNAEIIRRGYGFAYTKYPFKYMEEFRQYERDARETGRGLWAKETKKQNKVAPNVTVATVIASGYNTIDYGFVEG
ncbi:MAG: thermonuclease family protein, partial [Deltaproteobacteria bacterium]|nr:thermonuclease family protein [Candidatus Zymogenus saltonus]